MNLYLGCLPHFFISLLSFVTVVFCLILFCFCFFCCFFWQLVDDALDFSSTSEAMGKQTTADLSLGLATAPVLFAAQKVLRHYPLLLLL